MVALNITQAMKSISSEKCNKCGSQAKGLVYRKQAVTYYCKRCLRKNTKQDEMLIKGNEIKSLN